MTSKSTAEAAAQSGIGARTIERWKRDLAFWLRLWRGTPKADKFNKR